MKIAIVSGHFMPEVGYQEVSLARAFSRMGHQVEVFTTNLVSPTSSGILRESYQVGTTVDKTFGYAVHRLPARISYGSKVFSKGLRQSVKKYAPEVTVVIGLPKLFPAPLFYGEKLDTKIVLVVGESMQYAGTTKLQRTIYATKYRLIKNVLYSRALDGYCDKIVFNSPETEAIFRSRIPRRMIEAYRNKKLSLNLGYDSDDFFFDSQERKEGRSDLNLGSDDVMLVTNTRVTPGKNLEKVVDAVTEVASKGINLHYVITGFLDDQYGQALREYIHAQPDPSLFTALPFNDHHEVRKLNASADIGIWSQGAVSILEAMGTGLPVIIRNEGSVRHLIDDGHAGWRYDPDRLAEVIEDACHDLAKNGNEQDRSEMAGKNALRFSVDSIAQKMLNDWTT